MKARELSSWLAVTDVFRGMSKHSLNQLVKAGREVTHPDGREVILEGSGAVGFHLITAGQARVTSAGATRRVLSVGDFFGEISVIDGRPRSASVEAVEGLTTFVLDRPAFNQVLVDHPDFARLLLVTLCDRLREAEKR